MVVRPPGWPEDLPLADDPEFQQRVITWLLDLCPADYRAHEVFRRHPVVLAHAAGHHLEAALEGARAAYAGTRRALGEQHDASVVEATLRALEKEGARLSRRRRELDLVTEALQGARWAPRL